MLIWLKNQGKGRYRTFQLRLKQIESSLAKTEERRPGDVKNTDKQSAKAVEQARAQTSENPAFTAELKYREAVKRIKRATDAAELEGRKTQRRLQQMYAETPELAGLLRRSVDDVKAAVSSLHRLWTGESLQLCTSLNSFYEDVANVLKHESRDKNLE